MSFSKILHPRIVRIDASTVCQLRCPSCPTASGKIGQSLGSGFLKFRDFKKIVDDNPWISQIELSRWGEIFLNKELTQIISYAYERNVALNATNGVNLNNVSEETLNALVKYRFRNITCSIDGATQQTYAQYRRNGDLQKVIDNIRTINNLKCKYRSPYPLLKWQFVIFGHNEHEVGLARAMAKEWNMKFSAKLSWEDFYGEPFSPIQDTDLVRRETGLGVANREEYWQKYGRLYVIEQCCLGLWNQPQINYDGRLLGCHINYWSDYGNVFQEGLSSCLNNNKISYVREMLMGMDVSAQGTPCFNCKVYQKRKENNYWVKSKDIKAGFAASRSYIMLENKVLGTRLTKLASSARNKLRQFEKKGFRAFLARRLHSDGYPVQIPLPVAGNSTWQPFPVFRGAAAGLGELSCHASALLPGCCPHVPHEHKEEEILLVLSGEADIILPNAAAQSGKISRRLKTGDFVYYPGNFAHTIEAKGETAANYLMLKWSSAGRERSDELQFGCFNMSPSGAGKEIAEGFRSHRVFSGHTAYLDKLECHWSSLASNTGYEPHIDNYDVVIVVLKGQVETLGKTVSPFGVIFYESGKPHGMYNTGETDAEYLVFEFHASKKPFLKKLLSCY